MNLCIVCSFAGVHVFIQVLFRSHVTSYWTHSGFSKFHPEPITDWLCQLKMVLLWRMWNTRVTAGWPRVALVLLQLHKTWETTSCSLKYQWNQNFSYYVSLKVIYKLVNDNIRISANLMTSLCTSASHHIFCPITILLESDALPPNSHWSYGWNRSLVHTLTIFYSDWQIVYYI